MLTRPGLCSTARTRKATARQEIETDGEDVRDLFFPYPHFKIDKPVLFDLIAQADQLINHVDKVVAGKDVCWQPSRPQRLFCDFSLLLTQCLPA